MLSNTKFPIISQNIILTNCNKVMQDDRNIILYATKDESAEKELREKFKPQDTNVKLVAMDSKAVDDYLKQVEKQERKDETEDYSTQEQELTKQTEELVKTT